MIRRNLKIQLIYRGVLLLVAITSIVLSFTMMNLNAKDGNAPISPFLFYTNWSVYLASVAILASFICTLIQVIKGKKEGSNRLLPIVKFASVIMIIATFIVSAFVLPDKIWTAGYWTLSSIFKHFLLPIMVVADAIAFDPKRTYRVSYPFLALIAPLAYWIAVIVRALVYRSSQGGAIPEAQWSYYYPYGFTNFDNGHSVGGLIGLLGGILVGLILIGFLFYVFNHFSSADGKKKIDTSIDEESCHDIFTLAFKRD